jgi:putative multiple sugar transport system permease protein
MATTTTPQADPTPKEPEAAAALHTGTSNVRALITRNLRTSGIYVAFVAIVALFAILTDGVSLSPGNITNIVLQYSYILVLAIGMVLVIIAGHIDLSVGSVVALTGAVSAVLVIQRGYPWWAGVVAALAVGLAVGAWQGFWVAYVGIPAFIVTLAGMLVFRGLTLQVLDNISLSPFPAEYSKIASGFLNGLLGGNGYDAFTLLIGAVAVAGYAVSGFRTRVARIKYQQPVESFPLFIARVVLVGAVVMYFAWQLAHARGLPIVLIILGVLVLAYNVISKRTVFGRQIYAIGGNLAAAQLSAAFIGGAAVTGGVGTVVGAMVGGLIMAVMSNGMQLMGIEQQIQSIVKGLVLLLAVAFDVYNKRRAGASR